MPSFANTNNSVETRFCDYLREIINPNSIHFPNVFPVKCISQPVQVKQEKSPEFVKRNNNFDRPKMRLNGDLEDNLTLQAFASFTSLNRVPGSSSLSSNNHVWYQDVLFFRFIFPSKKLCLLKTHDETVRQTGQVDRSRMLKGIKFSKLTYAKFFASTYSVKVDKASKTEPKHSGTQALTCFFFSTCFPKFLKYFLPFNSSFTHHYNIVMI